MWTVAPVAPHVVSGKLKALPEGDSALGGLALPVEVVSFSPH